MMEKQWIQWKWNSSSHGVFLSHSLGGLESRKLCWTSLGARLGCTELVRITLCSISELLEPELQLVE